jgi:hypothetical protein
MAGFRFLDVIENPEIEHRFPDLSPKMREVTVPQEFFSFSPFSLTTKNLQRYIFAHDQMFYLLEPRTAADDQPGVSTRRWWLD